MARPRSDLHTLLKTITTNVYFQPPPTVQMEYPCIVYQRSQIKTDFADNLPYNRTKRYQITVIDRDPDSEIPDQVSDLPLCFFDRAFAAEQLNHDVFSLFF